MGDIKINNDLFEAVKNNDLPKIESLIKNGADVNAVLNKWPYNGKTVLWLAVQIGNVDLVEFLINNGADVNFAATEGPNLGETVLWRAVESRTKLEIVELLIKKGAEVNASPTAGDYKGVTALWMGARMRNYSVVKLLIDNGGYVDSAQTQGSEKSISVLWLAARDHQWDVVKLLIDKSADVNFAQTQGYEDLVSVLGLAAQAGNLDIVKLLIENHANINAAPTKGHNKDMTALWFAAAGGRWDAVELLIKHGADVNAAPFEGQSKGITALALAAAGGRWDAVELLIKHGADVNAAPIEGQSKGITALWLAAASSRWDIVELLIKEGAKVDAAPAEGPSKGTTVLTLAAQAGKLKILRLLIKHGADVNSAPTEGPSKGMTPLCFAARAGNLDVVRLLIKHRAGVNAGPTEGPSKGMTALWFAASASRWDVVKLLIKHEADVNAAPTEGPANGITALCLAAEAGNLDAVKLLIYHNADVNVGPIEGPCNGFTPLMFAAKAGNLDVVELLIKSHANINAGPTEGPTKGMNALLLAAMNGKWDVVKLLIDNGSYLTNLKIIPDLKLLELVTHLEKYQTANCIANLITLKKEVYERSLNLLPPAIRHEEVGDHDVSFAKVSLNEVKKLFSLKNIAAVPSFEESVESIQKIIIERINSSDSSRVLKNSLNPYNPAEFLASYDKNDANHLAYLWIMTFQNTMILRSDPAMGLVREMLSYIVACKNDIAVEKNLESATQIDDALVFQLSNLMQANEGMMSCAPGTPRGLKIVLNAYLSLANSESMLKDSLEQSVFSVFNKIWLDTFKDVMSANYANNLFNEMEKEQVVTWLSAEEAKEIDKYKSLLRSTCDLMAVIGSDNVENLLHDKKLDGRVGDAQITMNHLLLRNKKIKKHYPTYADFKNAVLANMRSTPEQKINLLAQHEKYLELQYVAVSNEKMRDMFYEVLDSKLSYINKQLNKINAPNNILQAINTYQTDSSNINRAKLKNVLQQSIGLLVDNFDLDRAQDVVNDVMKNIVYNKNLTLIDTKILFYKLKNDYDFSVNPDRQLSPHKKN